MFLSISLLFSYRDRLSSLLTLVMQRVWQPGQVAVLSPLLLKSAPLGHILSYVHAVTMSFLPVCFSMANVVDCVAVGSPVLLEFLIPDVLYQVSTEM